MEASHVEVLEEEISYPNGDKLKFSGLIDAINGVFVP